MAINVNPGTPLRQIGKVNSSSNFYIPGGTNVVFVSIHGASGGGGGGSGQEYNFGQYRAGGTGGAGIVSSGWVQVAQGSSVSVVIGAGGTGGAGGNPNGGAGATAGVSSFDGSLIANGGNGGNGGAPGSTGNAGNAGTASATTTLSTVNPGASTLTKVSGHTSQATGANPGGALGSGGLNTGQSGSSGTTASVNIYG